MEFLGLSGPLAKRKALLYKIVEERVSGGGSGRRPYRIAWSPTEYPTLYGRRRMGFNDERSAGKVVTSPAPWYRELSRYHWLVLLVAALGWMFDTMDQQLFNLARRRRLPTCAKLPLRKLWQSPKPKWQNTAATRPPFSCSAGLLAGSHSGSWGTE